MDVLLSHTSLQLHGIVIQLIVFVIVNLFNFALQIILLKSSFSIRLKYNVRCMSESHTIFQLLKILAYVCRGHAQFFNS